MSGRPIAKQHATTLMAQVMLLVAVGVAFGVGDMIRRPVKITRDAATDISEILGTNGDENAGAAIVTGTDEGPGDGATVEDGGAAATEPGVVAPKADGGGVKPAVVLPKGHITVEQAFELSKRQDVTFYDARSREEFVEGRIPGAVQLRLKDFDGGVPEAILLTDPMNIVVTYCTGGNQCEEAAELATLVEMQGFKTVFVLHDGYPGWVAAGHAVETGEPK